MLLRQKILLALIEGEPGHTISRLKLGIPSDWRTELVTPADYARLFARYEAEILPAPGAAQARQTALTALREKPSVLVCQEAAPQTCHHLRLARCLARETHLPLEELRLP